MYIFLDGCDHCNTFDSLVSWFHVVLEVWLANQQHTRNKPKMRQHAIQASFPAWLGESNLCFTIIFQDLMANTSMSTFWCHTFNVVLSMKGGNALRCAPGNFDDVMIWLEIVHSPIDTPREIFVFVTVFSSTATWISWHITNPVTNMSRYRGSNFLRQRLVLSTVSGRPVVITDIRVKATAANLTRSNFTCFIPVKFVKYSHFLGYFSPVAPCLVLAGWRTWFEGLRGALRSPLLAIGEFSSHGADYQAGFLWVCHRREALWPVPLRRPSWDCWTNCVMERASGPSLARLTEFTLRNSTVSEYGMIWQLIQFD